MSSPPEGPKRSSLPEQSACAQALQGEPFKLKGCGRVTSRLTAEILTKPLHLPTGAAKSEEEERGSTPSCVAPHTLISWAPFVLDVEKMQEL